MAFVAVVVVCLAGTPPHLCAGRDVVAEMPVPGTHLGVAACMGAGARWAAQQGIDPRRIVVRCRNGKWQEI
jgi:hypothetical protein